MEPGTQKQLKGKLCLHVFLLNSCLPLKCLNVIPGQQQSAEDVSNSHLVWDAIFQAKPDWLGIRRPGNRENGGRDGSGWSVKLELYRRESDMSKSGGDILLESDSWEGNQKAVQLLR